MKPKISFLAMFFSLSVLMILLSASDCKDGGVHNFDPNEIRDISSGDSEKPVRTEDDFFDIYSLIDSDAEFTELDPSLNLSQAIESLEFEVHPDWGVSIRAFCCVRNAKTLVVYNPRRPDVDFFSSRRFAVYWFKDGKPIKGTNRVECVCKGEFAAIVIYKPTNRAIGLAFYEGRACPADQLKTVLQTDDL